MPLRPARVLSPPLLLLTLTLCLVGIGVIAVYSASQSTAVLTKQLVFAGAGLLGLFLCYAIDYQHFRKLSLYMMAGTFVMCLLVFMPGIGIANKGAHRWIGAAGFNLQPSEFAKLALVIYMAKMLADRRQYLKSFFSGLFPALLLTGLFAVVIVVEPDFGATFVLCCVIFGMWLAAEMRWFHLLALVTMMIPAGVFAFLLEPYRMKRLLAFMVRDKETMLGAGFQLQQSLIAVGSGGFWGLGLGESRQKFHYLTEAHTDFIFAILCEEFGFLRVSLILLIYLAIILTGWRVALRTTDLFGSLLAAGITLMIFVNAAIHMCVVLGMMPTKGLVLPFISAGGSALIVSMAAMGLLMNVARNQYVHDRYGGD